MKRDDDQIQRRLKALRALVKEAASGRKQPIDKLAAVDALLFLSEPFSSSDLARILRKGKHPHPLPVERAIELYLMMARLMNLCEPRGQIIGPNCRVALIDFEKLTAENIWDRKGGLGLALRLIEQVTFHTGFDLLSTEERKLHERAGQHFIRGQKKPTLKILAATVLRNLNEDGKLYSDRSLPRYLKELKNYQFKERNPRRDYLIATVDNFGTADMSAREIAAEGLLAVAVHRQPRSLLITKPRQI